MNIELKFQLIRINIKEEVQIGPELELELELTPNLNL